MPGTHKKEKRPIARSLSFATFYVTLLLTAFVIRQNTIIFRLAGIAGFEPAREGVKVPCLTAWLYS